MKTLNHKIPFKSKLSNFRSIERRNKKFNSLPEKDQRREIAFDSVNILSMNMISAESGIYWNGPLGEKAIIRTNSGPDKKVTAKKFQERLLKIKPKENCTVCARGAMMLSQIRLGNEIDPRKDRNYEEGCILGGDDPDDFNKPNIKGFSEDDFLTMEEEFEHSSYNHPYQRGSNNKLANICCNVIKNGNFVVSDKTDYVKRWKLKVLPDTYL